MNPTDPLVTGQAKAIREQLGQQPVQDNRSARQRGIDAREKQRKDEAAKNPHRGY